MEHGCPWSEGLGLSPGVSPGSGNGHVRAGSPALDVGFVVNLLLGAHSVCL